MASRRDGSPIECTVEAEMPHVFQLFLPRAGAAIFLKKTPSEHAGGGGREGGGLCPVRKGKLQGASSFGTSPVASPPFAVGAPRK